MNIGENIRKLRKEKKLTLKSLGVKVGLSEQAIGQYERGDRTPNIEILTAISKALDCDLFHIIGLDETMENLDFQASILEKHLNIAEKQKQRQEEIFDNLTENGIRSFLDTTVQNLMFLAIDSTNINYDIDNFTEQELTEISTFLYNAYTLKVNEILNRHKNQ